MPVSGDCAELQFGKSQARNWIMDIVLQLKNPDLIRQLKPPDHTIQGFLVVSADGRAFDWLNDSDPAQVKTFLEHGLSWYRKIDAKHVSISDAELNEPFSKHPPSDATVVRTFSRIRPTPAGCDKLNQSVGRDHMWIFADEVREIVQDTPKAPSEVQSFPMPKTLAMRMVRFHLIDNVRGEPDMWRKEDVKKAEFSVHMKSENGNSRTYRFVGACSIETANSKRGLDGKIEGEFDVNCQTDKITRWRAYSESMAWGESRFTPGAPKGRFPLIVAMTETNDETSKIVPPQAVSYGENYRDP